MRKTLFVFGILVALFSLTACTTQKSVTPLNDQAGLSEEGNSNLIADEQNASAPTEVVADALAVNPGNSSETSPVDNNSMKTPDQQVDLKGQYSQVVLKTSLGNITLKLDAAAAPLTVNNFLNLAQSGFYNGTKFHRVIKDFMIQGGDPLTKADDASVYGTGGPSYRFADEFNNRKLVAGSLAMANSGPNTNGSQFFIVTAEATPWLDGRHTNFGEVVDGLDIVRKIENTATNPSDQPLVPVVVNSAELLK